MELQNIDGPNIDGSSPQIEGAQFAIRLIQLNKASKDKTNDAWQKDIVISKTPKPSWGMSSGYEGL